MASEALSTDNLNKALRRWHTRLRIQHSVRWIPGALVIGLSLALILTIAARIWPLLPQSDVIRVSIGLVLLALASTLLLVWSWRRSALHLAQRFDHLFGLKERISTAIELADGAIPSESRVLVQAQHQQAVAAVGKVRPSDYLPLSSDVRTWLVALILLAALTGAILIPNPQDDVLAAQAEVEEAIAEELEELEQLRREVLESDQLTEDQQLEVIETLDEAIESLSQARVSQAEALAALSEAERELRDLSEMYAAEQQAALADASERLGASSTEQLQSVQTPEELQEALQSLAEQLSTDPASMSSEEQQALAEALQDAAEALATTNPDLAEALQEAAEALQNGEAGEAAEALAEAAEAAEATADATQVEQFADQIGKGEQSLSMAGRGQNQGEMGQGQGMTELQTQELQVPGNTGTAGAGRGEGDGPVEGGVAGNPMETDNAPGDGGLQEFEELYSPQRAGGEGGEQVDIPGGPGAGAPTGREGDFAENPTGESTVPYNEVYADYAGSVNEALDSGYVPLGMRDLVRDYFSRLDPTSGSN